jgi:hypothetical protein
VFGLLGGAYLLLRGQVISDELAPARLTAQVQQLAAVLPTLKRLEVTYYQRDDSCRAFSYRRGDFIGDHSYDCDDMSADLSFDDAANQDAGQLEAVLAAAGLNANEVIGSPSTGAFEFDTDAPSWCLFCPNVRYFHASSTKLPADDDWDHYLAIDSDWYVDIYFEGLLPGYQL